MDKELVVFNSKVIKIAEKNYRASCSGKDAEAFVDRLFCDYRQAGRPKDVDAWLSNTLAREFLWVSKPPNWVEDEPSWPYFDGRPMVFVRQMSVPRNPVTESSLTWDVELYLFGTRVDLPPGFRVEYEVVTQIAGIDGEGTR